MTVFSAARDTLTAIICKGGADGEKEKDCYGTIHRVEKEIAPFGSQKNETMAEKTKAA